MVVGLVLIVIAVLIFLAMAFTMDDKVHPAIGAISVDTNTFVVFLAGAATLLLFVMGLEIARNSAGRKMRRRRERKELRKRDARLERDRDRESPLDRDRADEA